MTTDTKPKPFLRVKLNCACGATLFVSLPQQPERFANLPDKIVDLATAWSRAHAPHHQEPKKP
jgi:hypothetical protein